MRRARSGIGPAKPEPLVERRRSRFIRAKPNKPERRPGVIQRGSDECPADAGPSMPWQHIEVPHPTDCRCIAIGIAVKPAHANEFGIVEGLEESLAHSIESVEPGLPLVAQACHKHEPLGGAAGNQLFEAGKALDVLDGDHN